MSEKGEFERQLWNIYKLFTGAGSLGRKQTLVMPPRKNAWKGINKKVGKFTIKKVHVHKRRICHWLHIVKKNRGHFPHILYKEFRKGAGAKSFEEGLPNIWGNAWILSYTYMRKPLVIWLCPLGHLQNISKILSLHFYWMYLDSIDMLIGRLSRCVK